MSEFLIELTCWGHWTTGIPNTADQVDHYCFKARGHKGRCVCECGDRHG